MYSPHGKSSVMSASHFELAQMVPVERPTKPNCLPIFMEDGLKSKYTMEMLNREEILIEYDH